MTDPDERISAYLDGAMSEAEAQAFEADIEADPALAERLARWQGNDATMRAGFEPAPLDEALLARLGLAPAAQTAPAEIIDLAARRRQAAATQPWQGRRVWAAAAAVVLAVGVLGSALWGRPSSYDLADSSAFQTALNELPSNATASLEDGSAVTPVLSFAAGDGRLCREFHHDASGTAREGIACRGNEDWRVQGIVVVAAIRSDGSIEPAGGGDTAALDEIYARLNPSDPFGPDEEKRHIAAGWAGKEKVQK
jgi:hypothetical protein